MAYLLLRIDEEYFYTKQSLMLCSVGVRKVSREPSMYCGTLSGIVGAASQVDERITILDFFCQEFFV